MILDGLRNVVASLGTWKAKGAHTEYVDIARSAQQLKAAYDTSWLPAKIVDIPARDAVRQWRAWSGDSSAAEEIEQRISLQRRVLQALTAARLYGGAALYVDTGSRTPDVPLQDGETIERLVVLPGAQVTWPAPNPDPLAPVGNIFTVGTRRVHTSRLALFHGVPPVAGEYGWGNSVLKRAWDAVRNANSVPAAVAELVWEAKVDVYKIPNFMAQLQQPGYERKVAERFSLANRLKSINNAIVLDAEEDYQQKQLAFGDLANLILTVYQVAAGAADIPVTRLLGQSAAGLNSAGDNEVRDYYDSIRAMQTLQIAPALSAIDAHIAAKTGQRVNYQWRSLWQLSLKEQADVLKTQADAIGALATSDLIEPDVLRGPVVEMLAEVLPGIDDAYEEFTGGDDAI